MSNDNNINTKDFLIGVLIGGIAGAASALLLAPKSGKELREDLNKKAQNAKEMTSDFTDIALEKGAEYATLAKEKSASIAKTVSDQSSQLVDRVKEITQNVKNDVKEKCCSTNTLPSETEEVSGIDITNKI